MGNLYSKVPPIPSISDSTLIVDEIETAMQEADEVKIAVGYVSVAGLIQLDKLVRSNKINHIDLVIGMYKVEGIPESIYNKITEVNT
ncbi:restriction endonuclease PLD domain-containing protein [Levilactobacillus yiduensis]|uniref:restriction endonuclease PLD domain-containing protein n=1 Tax=Levilactobacillus yiduensis TaxID=2953880 RepID=UPI000EF34A79|nr:restriction endonuclease PLD domain-containing protein [Levilactobacillus yiduensis]AYM02107.1 NgoFVII family restriction endonuclease [Levilactobacillus brevis]